MSSDPFRICNPWLFGSQKKVNVPRVETMFSQLCDQMMLKWNYRKTFVGLSTRLIAKVASSILLQYINDQNSGD